MLSAVFVRLFFYMVAFLLTRCRGYVVQLAKIAGLTVVADASEADEDLVRSLGADVVVLRGPDLAERFRSQFPDGVDGAGRGGPPPVRGRRGPRPLGAGLRLIWRRGPLRGCVDVPAG